MADHLPVRGAEHGVDVLNRPVQQAFRQTWLSRATSRGFRKIHPPLGPQGIIDARQIAELISNVLTP